MVARVAVARADRKDVREEALRLAADLDRRIQAVLAGEIDADPPRPERETTATAAELRSLPSQTLSPADVGSGVAVAKEGRYKKDNFQAYYRQFEDVVVGGSHLLSLRGETQLYETPQAAAVAYKVVQEKAGREFFAQALVKGFSDGAGVEPTDLRVRALPDPGHGISGMVATFEGVGQRFKMVALFTRSGRVLQSVMGICHPSLNPDDLTPLAERASRRLSA